MKRLPSLFLILFELLFNCAYSQQSHLKFERIDIDKGLSNGNVIAILQDSKGYMWFGTKDGLNKYDGYEFTIYKNELDNSASIIDNYINCIIEDNEGFIWAATWGGLSRYDRKLNRFTNFTNNEKNSNSIASNLVSVVLQDKEHHIWIGTDNKGLDMYDPVKKQFTHYQATNDNAYTLTSNHISDLFEDINGNLWVATDKGLNLFNKQTKKFTHYLNDPKNSQSLSNNDVYHLFEDSHRNFWVGTNGGGLNLLNRETGEFTHFNKNKFNSNSISEDIIYTLGEDAEGNLWIGTESNGICIYNTATGNFVKYVNDPLDKESPGSNSIYSIIRDRNKNMWVGSFLGGLSIMKASKHLFPHYRHSSLSNSLSSSHILSIFEDSKKRVWIGTSEGVNLFNKDFNKFTSFKHKEATSNSICGDYILCITEDSKGNIWIGTWNQGISIFNPGKNTYRHLKNDPANKNSLANNNAWRIMEDKEKNIWIATYGGGLDRYDPRSNSFTHYTYDIQNDGLSSNRATCLLEDQQGKIWIGTDGGGLDVLDKLTKQILHYQHQPGVNSISSNVVNGIFKDGDSALWITTSNGLNHLSLITNHFVTYTTKNGLPDNKIFGALEDNHQRLWVSSNSGIFTFKTTTHEIESYDITDGLQSKEFKDAAYCKLSNGEMLFGGINGFNAFYPDSIKKEKTDFQLLFTKFQLFNKDVSVSDGDTENTPLTQQIEATKTITLSYKESVFSFEFATLNYAADEKNQYAYMMEGFDKNWNYIGSKNRVTFTNLNPGHYVFNVRGLTSGGKLSNSSAAIEVNILPPFWVTWWFKILCLIFLGGAAAAFYFIRVHAVEVQRTKLQQQVNEQTQQLKQAAIIEHNAREESDELNRLLQKKNTELEQFVYIASHDLQEPLRTTTSFIELLERKYKDQLDDNARKYLNFIVDASVRMKTLITHLLDYSRIGGTKEKSTVDGNTILTNVLADLDTSIKNAHAHITAAVLPSFTGYPVEIKQLFQNLLINAIKFRKPDVPPQISISVADAATHWQFSIKDNGIGIDEQYKEKIFLIFQRLHSKTEYEGSGIGLAHCKKIVEIHGGSIWIESTLGQGSTFHFTIKK